MKYIIEQHYHKDPPDDYFSTGDEPMTKEEAEDLCAKYQDGVEGIYSFRVMPYRGD